MESPASRCPGCGSVLPRDGTIYNGYYHASPQCWGVFQELQGYQISNNLVGRYSFQLSIDTYASQHAGGDHPDKSIAIHLAGLALVLDYGVDAVQVAPLQQRLAGTNNHWPHLDPPRATYEQTVVDVLLAEFADHREVVASWAREVYEAWSGAHSQVRSLVDETVRPNG